MRVVRWRRAQRANDLDVLWRIRKMIFAADHVRDFHLEIVNHVHEMKDPGAKRAPDGHIRVRGGIAEIEIDSAAHDVVHDDVLAR